MSDCIEIYTDGSCSKNPGPGGWGVLIINDGLYYEYGGGEEETTNNIMEMTAAIEALVEVAEEEGPVKLYTDSQYLKKGITEWIHGWKSKGWRKSDGDEVKNVDLWQELDDLNRPNIQWEWVKGHSDNIYNQRVDEIARAFSTGNPIPLRDGEPAEDFGKDSFRFVESGNGKKIAPNLSGVEKLSDEPEKNGEVSSSKKTNVLKEDERPPAVTAVLREEEAPHRVSVYVGAPWVEKFAANLENKGFVRFNIGEDPQNSETVMILKGSFGDEIYYKRGESRIQVKSGGVFKFFGRIDAEIEEMIASIRDADDFYLEKYIKKIPLDFHEPLETWSEDCLSEMLRPFFKGIVTKWKYNVENDFIHIEDASESGLGFEVFIKDGYKWKKRPPVEIENRIREYAAKILISPDRVVLSALEDSKSALSLLVLPFARNVVNLAIFKDWRHIKSNFHHLDGAEVFRIKKQIKNYLKGVFKYKFSGSGPLSVVSEMDDFALEKISKWILETLKIASHQLPGALSRFPVDLLVDWADLRNMLREFYSGKTSIKLTVRPLRGYVEQKVCDLADFVLSM